MITFQIASDLHIEYKNNLHVDPLSLITPSADILILAGDIGSFYKFNQLKTFLIRLCKYFKLVLYVPGNCEYYRQKNYPIQKMKVLFSRFKHLENIINNFYILNRSSLEFGDICIVGCTLWSNPLVKIPNYIVRINEMTTQNYFKNYMNDLEYIKTMIDYSIKNKKTLIVITHYCPSYSIIMNSTNEEKKKDYYISLYANNLDYLLKKEYVHTWISGHIHINYDTYSDGGTRLVGNQLGKSKDNIQNYSKNFTINV